jgi:hypothetical protein
MRPRMRVVFLALALLDLAAIAGCLSADPTQEEMDHESPLATTAVVQDIPAVNRVRYPDSVAYMYESSLATIFWMQNEPRAGTLANLEQRLRRDMQAGLKGEFLISNLHRVEPVGGVQPSLSSSAKRTAQSMRLLTQYAFVAYDYARSLGSALHDYNSDPARLQALNAKAAQVNTLLYDMADPHHAGPLPRPPPPVGAQTIRDGKYFADAVRDHARANLTSRVAALRHAITSRNADTYASSFADVFFAQRDAEVADIAVNGLADHHEHGILRGQPLDRVIDQYVNTQPTAARPMSMDQLNLINRINLLAGDPSVSRGALVAALLLINEDHRQGEVDLLLSSSSIWQRVHDREWLVSQLVRLGPDDMTEAQISELIANIVASV